jgi:type VI protein secretion system component VasF
MNLAIWQDLIAAHREAGELIAQTTPEAAATDLEALPATVGEDAMASLHAALRQSLGRLAAKLGARLDEAELKQLLFVLAIALDEKVQRRLAPDDAPRWPLLQRALFDVHDGGDLFYDLVEDRLGRADSADQLLLFELCYFCLGDGFVGRHSRNRPAIDEQMRRLVERIPRAFGGGDGEERTKAFTGFVPRPRLPRRYWLWGAASLALLPVLFLLLW